MIILFIYFFYFSPPAGTCEISSNMSFNAACWNQNQQSLLWDAMYEKACSLTFVQHPALFCYDHPQKHGIFKILFYGDFLTCIIIPK